MTARRFQHHFGARRLPSVAARDWKRRGGGGWTLQVQLPRGPGQPRDEEACVGRSSRAAEAAERAPGRLSGSARKPWTGKAQRHETHPFVMATAGIQSSASSVAVVANDFKKNKKTRQKNKKVR